MRIEVTEATKMNTFLQNSSNCPVLLLSGVVDTKSAMLEPGKFARVVIPSPLRQSLVYGIPPPLLDRIFPGMRVLIPMQKRTVTGVVWEILDQSSLPQVKEIIALLDDRPILDLDLLKLAQWISQYYLTSLGEVLATMLPPNSRRESQRTIILKDAYPAVTDDLEQKLVQLLAQRKGKLTVKFLTRYFSGQNIDSLIARLEKRGVVDVEDRLAKQRRKTQYPPNSVECSLAATANGFNLTGEQTEALRPLSQQLDQNSFKTFLLHGVTGSGKTEVYLRAIEKARSLGRSSLVLIPEISLTPQLLDRVTGRFPGRVGVLHSALTAAERWAQWWRIANRNVDVVVGARSAVFAPLPNLGLIVVDEEHDSSYKQEDSLRYNGRDVAVVRGKLLNCPVVLGSATPSLESYQNCRLGRYQLLEISQRVEQRPLPTIELCDLRTQYRSPDSAKRRSNQSKVATVKDSDQPLMAQTFVDALQQNFLAKRQTLIFLNRRGFANFLQCTLCGYVWRCPHCSVTLTSHLKQKNLSCHHCDYRRPTTHTCPECKNESLAAIGAGTEQIETVLQQIVPDARIARMDRDTTSKRGSQEALIRRWEKGDIDILVGTQMITKGHDVFGVTLVGALLADLSLNLPDFRAAERTFQLLSQVGGRSGRGDDPGRVIIQTYAPDHYALQFLLTHDYQGFFNTESEFRRALNYPPFGRVINLRFDGPKLAQVEKQAQSTAQELRELQNRSIKFRDEIEVLGPAPAPIEKLRNRFRWQLLLKGKQSSLLLELARHALKSFPRSRSVRLHVDVDPYSML